MTRATLCCTLLALIQTANLYAQDGPVRSIFPNLPSGVPTRDSGVMDIFGPEIDVGLDAQELRDIVRVLAAGREKRQTIRVIENHWRLPGGQVLFPDVTPRDLLHGDFKVP